MFRFQHPEYLYLLLLVPLLAGLFYGSRLLRRQALKRLGEENLLGRIMPGRSEGKLRFKFVVFLMGTALLILSLSNPQWGTARKPATMEAADVLIALDISRSMLATDVARNRLEAAKRFAQELVSALPFERIGCIFFAGSAYLQTPLTLDHREVQLILKSADPGMLSSQGTALGETLQLAAGALPADAKGNRVLVIISDGEAHDEEVVEQARKTHQQGFLLYTVGVGTTRGSYIPVRAAGGRSDYVRDQAGQPVLSALDEQLLQDIAAEGQGTYFHLASGSAGIIRTLQEQIDQLEKQEFERPVFSEYASYFQYFLAAALLLLTLEFGLSYRKGYW
jgi:Ca-activated chloride channel family protein